MITEGKSKKRKISDFFAPMPKKVTRTINGKLSNKEVDQKPYIDDKDFDKTQTNCTSTDQATQTDFFEVDCNQKEGLKFIAERIFNFESMRIHGNYDLCSIADKRSYPKTEQAIINEAHYNMDIIQEYESQFSPSSSKSQEVNFPERMTEKEATHMNHKTTCWGEDNPDVEFLSGMKFMAYRIRKTELSRLDYDEFTTDWQFKWESDNPIDLINEVASTMAGMRKLKDLLLEDHEFSDAESNSF